MSVAYLITSHRLPQQLRRLAELVRRGSPTAPVVIHHDRSAPPLDRSAWRDLEVDFLEPAHRVKWGDISHVETVLASLTWMRERKRFDWLILISGQDYPIRPVREIERRLAVAEVDAFVEAAPCASPDGRLMDEFAQRYFLQWFSVPRGLAASHMARTAAARSSFMRLRDIPRSGGRLGVRPLRTPFDDGFGCYRGADWFNLTPKAIDAVLEGARSRRLLPYYRRTLIPNESFIQTVLANDDRIRLSGDVRRYTKWDQPHGTGPRVLRHDDLDEILGAEADFARKFDEEIDCRVLDEIDRRVHGVESCERQPGTPALPYKQF